MAEVHDERPAALRRASGGASGRLRRLGRRCFASRGVAVEGIRRACLAMSAFVVSILCLGSDRRRPVLRPPVARPDRASTSAADHGRAQPAGRQRLSVRPRRHRRRSDRTRAGPDPHSPVGHRRGTAPGHHGAAGRHRDRSLGLLTGDIRPRQLDIRDVDLRLLILADGQVAVSAGTGAAAVPLARAFAGPVPSGSRPRRRRGRSGAVRRPTTRRPRRSRRKTPCPTRATPRCGRLTAVLRSLVDATTTPGGALGTLDAGQRHRPARPRRPDPWHDVGLQQYRAQLRQGGRRLRRAEGCGGRPDRPLEHRGAGDARGRRRVKTLTVEVHDLSLDEITLAGGLRNLGFDFDMPVSGSASVRIRRRAARSPRPPGSSASAPAISSSTTPITSRC